jgi:myo-inositol-1(or 4)-monophosphatase
VNGTPLSADHDRPLARSTASVVLGLDAVRDPARRAEATAVRDRVADRAKRVLETWSPCVDWGLLARGATAGIVCAYPDAIEQAPGELLADEAGVVADWIDVGDATTDTGNTNTDAGDANHGYYVGAADRTTLSELRDAVRTVLDGE